MKIALFLNLTALICFSAAWGIHMQAFLANTGSFPYADSTLVVLLSGIIFDIRNMP